MKNLFNHKMKNKAGEKKTNRRMKWNEQNKKKKNNSQVKEEDKFKQKIEIE